jgi:iron complex transport system substrate-binding protein
VSSTVFPLQITDTLGRDVTIRAQPQRVVSLAPSNTERLFAVGAGSRVVGVTLYDTYPPEAQTRDKVGGFTANSLSVEKIVGLRPDLVLAAGDIQRPVIEALARLGMPVVAIEDPRHVDEVYAALRLVGQLMGRQAAAEACVAAIQAHVARVRQKVATLSPEQRVTVFYEVFDTPLMTAGPQTFVGQMLEMAGGINIFADLTGRYMQVSPEEVVRRNPDCILSPGSQRQAWTPVQIKRRPGWGHLAAVKQDCIHFLDEELVSRPGPRVAEGLETIARALYPALFP